MNPVPKVWDSRPLRLLAALTSASLLLFAADVVFGPVAPLLGWAMVVAAYVPGVVICLQVSRSPAVSPGAARYCALRHRGQRGRADTWPG